MSFLGKRPPGGQDDPARAAADAVARAFSLCNAGEDVQAEMACRGVLGRAPGHAGALHCLGVIALRRHRIDEAVQWLQQAIQADNADIQIRYDLAEAYRLAQRWRDGCTVYKVVLEARPQVMAARMGYAECLASVGEMEQASRQCAQILAEEPGERRALMLAADLALNGHAPAGAEDAFRKALQREPDDARLLQGMANLLVDLGRVDECASLLRRLAPDWDDAAHFTSVRLLESVVQRRLPALVRPQPAPSADPAADARPLISVIICSIDRVKYETVTAHYAELLAGERFELIGIHDARSLCEGYNRAARQAAGDILVFSHDDIEILTADFAGRLKRHLARHDVVGACGTSRMVSGHWMRARWPYLHGLVAHHFPADHPDRAHAGKYRVMVLDTLAEDATGNMQGLDGMFIAARREVVERCPFDEALFDGFHLYDMDFTFSAYLAGFDVAVFRDITIIHYTYGDSPGYSEAFERYKSLFEQKYRDDLLPMSVDSRRFLPAVFDDKDQVARFCSELLAFRRVGRSG